MSGKKNSNNSPNRGNSLSGLQRFKALVFGKNEDTQDKPVQNSIKGSNSKQDKCSEKSSNQKDSKASSSASNATSKHTSDSSHKFSNSVKDGLGYSVDDKSLESSSLQRDLFDINKRYADDPDDFAYLGDEYSKDSDNGFEDGVLAKGDGYSYTRLQGNSKLSRTQDNVSSKPKGKAYGGVKPQGKAYGKTNASDDSYDSGVDRAILMAREIVRPKDKQDNTLDETVTESFSEALEKEEQKDSVESFEKLLYEVKPYGQSVESFSRNSKTIVKIKQDKVSSVSNVLDKSIAKVRQDAASVDKKQETDHVSSGFVKMVDPNEVLSYKTPGAQPYMLRKLKNGEYMEADFIDLHGKTVEQAYDLIRHFIAHAIREEFRCVLIIHGKGVNQKPKAQIKSFVNHWLRQMPAVLAFHSAPEFKGGNGAVMIILKKGDKSSAINREEHARR